MRKATFIKTGVASAAVLAMAAGLATPATANPQAQLSDVVIVGSDTAQFMTSFTDDGMRGITGVTGMNAQAGYNATNRNRIFSYDATLDGLGRTTSVASGGVGGEVLRYGTAPMHLPNGSGDGYNYFAADTLSGAKIMDFVRGSRLPKTADVTNMTNASDHYHSWRIASDGMQIAVSNSESNAPAAGLTKAQLQGIYSNSPTYVTWHDINSSLSTDAIVPMLPQDGSGTHDDFVGDLGAPADPTNPDLVRTEEHDPSPLTPSGFASLIQGAPYNATDTGSKDAAGNEIYSWNGHNVTVADAISPFSTGRYNLIQKGYFDVNRSNGLNDPAWKDALKLLPSSTGYFYQRYLYLSARESAYESTTGWQTGSTTNKVQAVINWYNSAQGRVLITDAGVTPNFADCGEDATTTAMGGCA